MSNLPIVLAHGIARFDVLSVRLRKKLNLPDSNASDKGEYFRGIKTHLENHGFTVFHPDQSFAGPVELRASQLRDHVDKVLQNTNSSKVHIIAHSMGGLDARHMIVDLGMADKVETLTTIGTPHHGSPVADRLVNSSESFLLDILGHLFDVRGVKSLTTDSCEAFNRRAEDSEARNPVRYQTYSAFEGLKDVFAPLVPAWLIVQDQEGKNDGLVSVRSQQWTRELVASDGSRNPVAQHEFPFPADHLNEVGWWDPEEAINPLIGGSLIEQAMEFEQQARDLYLTIARGL